MPRAKLCVELHGGELPRDFDALAALPGIGRSTAGAILAQAWGERLAILDGNVKRVLCRVHGIDGWPGTPAVEKQLWAIAEAHCCPTRAWPTTRRRTWISAPPCARAHDPACVLCPLQDDCVALPRRPRRRTAHAEARQAAAGTQRVMLLLRDDERPRAAAAPAADRRLGLAVVAARSTPT